MAMPKPPPLFPLLLTLVVGAVSAGCNRTGARGEGGLVADTAASSPLNGIPERQLKQRAEPLSPEQAKAMGIDSANTFPGSAVEASEPGEPGVPRIAPVPDSARASATARDSVPAAAPAP